MRRTRGGDLLKSAIAGGELTADDVARTLGIDPSECDQLIAGTLVMSLDNQLRFATLVIDRVPRLARRGYALRAQAGATLAFKQQATEVHSWSPMKWSAQKAR
jgi:hypothetical protein